MSPAPKTDAVVVLVGTPWDAILERLLTPGAGRHARRMVGAAGEDLPQAVARAHSSLIVALEATAAVGDAARIELVGRAAQVLYCARACLQAAGGEKTALDRGIAGALAASLNSHELGVLAGELSYRVTPNEAHNAAARARRPAARPQDAATHGDGVALRAGAVDLASLLVRAAANVAITGHADRADAPHSPRLDQALAIITNELADRACALERAPTSRDDIAAHHLAAALRLQSSGHAADTIGAVGNDHAPPASLAAARELWMLLATREYAAATALDADLAAPAYRERFTSITEAIVTGAANIVDGSHLADRAAAFRHRSAWRHQAVALTHAIETHAAARRGDAGSREQALVMTLTRLTRAVVAIALLNGRRQAVESRDTRPIPHRPEETHV